VGGVRGLRCLRGGSSINGGRAGPSKRSTAVRGRGLARTTNTGCRFRGKRLCGLVTFDQGQKRSRKVPLDCCTDERRASAFELRGPAQWSAGVTPDTWVAIAPSGLSR